MQLRTSNCQRTYSWFHFLSYHSICNEPRSSESITKAPDQEWKICSQVSLLLFAFGAREMDELAFCALNCALGLTEPVTYCAWWPVFIAAADTNLAMDLLTHCWYYSMIVWANNNWHLTQLRHNTKTKKYIFKKMKQIEKGIPVCINDDRAPNYAPVLFILRVPRCCTSLEPFKYEATVYTAFQLLGLVF